MRWTTLFVVCLFIIWAGAYFFFNGPILKQNLRGSDGSTFEINNVRTTDLTALIVVAGHAVVKIDQLATADVSDSGWFLLSYQKKQGFPGIITSHIKAGIELAEADPAAMLVFSGGQTRRDVGPTSEAASYFYLAAQHKWASPSAKSRTFLEEFARDSFENLLLSIARYDTVALLMLLLLFI